MLKILRMRLGQLSRRLEINAKNIVNYLNNEYKIEIINHPNSKIPDEVLDEVLIHFKPSPVEEMKKAIEEPTNVAIEEEMPLESEMEEKSVPTPIETTEPTITPSQKTPVEERIEVASCETASEEVLEEDLNIVDGVIKAPKLEIEGVKVIGKIDLPEQKKQEDVEVNETSTESDITQQEEGEREPTNSNNEEVKEVAVKPEIQKKERPKRPKHKNPTQKRKRPTQEELEARRKAREERLKKEEEARVKAKKKAHYEALLVKKVARTKKNQNKKSIAKKSAPKTKKQKLEKPTSLWGKFMLWLNDK